MREEFSLQVKDVLAKRVGYQCSNPTCRQATVGPHQDSKKVINIGVAAHITAASIRGPRFDKSLSIQQRTSVQNGIWLCQNCAKLIDNDPQSYTLVLLHSWKLKAEENAINKLENKSVDLSSTNPKLKHVEIPKLYGLPYDDARVLLINSGWQPVLKHWSYFNNSKILYGNGQVFWERGYHEINHSYGTGIAHCNFKFADVRGQHLTVVTAGEEIMEENIKAIVVRWYF